MQMEAKKWGLQFNKTGTPKQVALNSLLFRALSGRLKLTARRHKFNQDYPLVAFIVWCELGGLGGVCSGFGFLVKGSLSRENGA